MQVTTLLEVCDSVNFCFCSFIHLIIVIEQKLSAWLRETDHDWLIVDFRLIFHDIKLSGYLEHFWTSVYISFLSNYF